MKRQWTKEEAWNWHNNRDWIRGCNFIGSDCCSRVDMWQSYKSKEHLATADRELALCKETGFNAIRIILDFEVWYQKPESYMNILEAYLALAHKNGQGVMICLTGEALLPHGEFSEFKLKPLGEQIYALGHHQGRFPLSEEEKAKKPYHYMEHPELKAPFLTMMKNIVTKYKDDERVICWNVYNEPGINIGENSIPLLRELFDLVRACDPMQPLTADADRSFAQNGSIESTILTSKICIPSSISKRSPASCGALSSAKRRPMRRGMLFGTIIINPVLMWITTLPNDSTIFTVRIFVLMIQARSNF